MWCGEGKMKERKEENEEREKKKGDRGGMCGSGGIFGSVSEVVEQKNFICNQDLNLRIKLRQILRFTNMPFFNRVHE